MAITRSVTRKKNQDECSRKRAKALAKSDKSPWLKLMDELLILIILRLGVADFDSFRAVCKRWRSIAHSTRDLFLSTRKPMSLSFSTVAYEKYCHLADLESRSFKTNLPHLFGRTCVGSTCGYLILYGTKAYDFWLVNPITRHELHFPRCYTFPHFYTNPTKVIRGILVFSPSVSRWVFVLSVLSSDLVWFCLDGKGARWNHLLSGFPIYDLHFFKGKIYGLTKGSQLFEVRLDIKLLKFVGTKFLNSDLLHPKFASWGEKLYVVGYTSDKVLRAMEVDLDQMKFGCPFKPIENYVCYVNMLKSGGCGKVGLWANPCEQYERFGNFHGNDKVNHKGGLFNSNMWYFPHECLNDNRLQA